MTDLGPVFDGRGNPLSWNLVTPRQVLREMRKHPNRPWWADKLAKEMAEHLTKSLFHGKPLIDTPMSSAACEAVLEEARKAVQEPKSNDQLLAELRASLQ